MEAQRGTRESKVASKLGDGKDRERKSGERIEGKR